MKDTILFGDCRETLKQFDEKARVCVTSPPYYGLRDYGGEDNQIGMEQTPEDYVEEMVKVFRLVRDNLTDDGTLWLNIGDSYYNYRSDGNYPKQTLSKTRHRVLLFFNPLKHDIFIHNIRCFIMPRTT